MKKIAVARARGSTLAWLPASARLVLPEGFKMEMIMWSLL